MARYFAVAPDAPRTHVLRFLLAFSIGGGVPMYGTAEPITWFKLNQPPSIIADGPEQDRGYTDQRVDLVRHTLSQYTINLTAMPPIRALQLMKEGGPYCTGDLLKTKERDVFLRFTSPVSYVLPIGLVVRQEDKKHYDHYADANHMISLEGLMRLDHGVLGVGVRRTYGKAIDNQVTQALAVKSARLAQVYGENTTGTLFKMLDAHHIDALLAFPVEQVYLSEQSKRPDGYYSYSVVESQNLVPVRFSCTRQTSTDSIFAALEAQAESAALQHSSQQAYERWLPSYLVPAYRARLKDAQAAGL